jgi:histidinol-phosphatase
MTMPFQQELDLARSVARRAGELALQYQTRGITPEDKSDASPVTIADRECEKLIARTLEEHFPQDGILGEEGSAKESSNGRKWIIDPIDGTRDFVRGLPLWSVLIGLEVNGVVETGVSFLAPRNEMFFAIRGQGAYKDDVRIGVSKIESASRAVLSVNGMHAINKRPFAPRLVPWMSRFWAVRSLGGCVDAMLLASGQIDVWIENTAKAWDLAPLRVILEEAGAHFGNFDGGRTIYGGDCFACVPALLPEVSELLGLS